MAILSTGTSGISNVLYRNLQKKTAVILKRIDQILQNLTRVHNLVGFFIKNLNFFIFPIVSVFCCSYIVQLLFQL